MRISLLILILAAQTVRAASTIYLPVSDGSMYSASDVVAGGYLGAEGSYEGDIHFQAFVPPSSSTISLSLGLYGLPAWGINVQVYGYSTTEAIINGSDYNAGNLLGTIVLPDNNHQDFRQYYTLDVTSFINSAAGPYFGFRLVTDGLDTFNSLNYYTGQPEELIVTTVPEPSSWNFAILGTGLGILSVRRFFHRKAGR
jgi:hypothetical protein